MKNFTKSIVLASSVLLGSAASQAGIMQFGGYINSSSTNGFGANFGEALSGSLSYSATMTGTGQEVASLDSLSFSGSSFSINLPFPLNPFAQLQGSFLNGSLVGLFVQDIVTDNNSTPHQMLMTGGPSFDINTLNNSTAVSGCFDFGFNVCTNPKVEVAEPAALSLTLMGLMGLMLRRRSRKGLCL